MRRIAEILLLLHWFNLLSVEGTRYSLPGKPTLTRCRSPEKETFTCWWEPSFDGGLSTTYALYYCKENSDTVHECPDYHTAGVNSCFFNKNNTSIWVNYNITVVATNALGSTFSDPVEIDVVYIVMPHPPENVGVTVLEDKGWPFLRLSWEPPHKVDTRSGWITLIYELRVKLEEETEWEMHLAGQQKMFNIFSLRSGGTYLVQVRCKPDHGFWSEWSSTTSIKVPDYFQRERSVWVMIMVSSAFIFLIITWLIHINSHSLKHYILPPVPGPKIKGFDKQFMKDGKSEGFFCDLVSIHFPATTTPNDEDLLVEYLEVCVPEEQELKMEDKGEDGCPKSESSTSDCDSGRGSCDSQTLLIDKCFKRVAPGLDIECSQTGTGANEIQDSPDVSSGRVKTWPSVYSPLSQHPVDLMHSLDKSKQHCLSDTLFPSDSSCPYHSHPDHSTNDNPDSTYWKFCFNNKQRLLLRPQMETQWQPHAYSEVNISATVRSSDYVEAHNISDENTVVLHSVSSSHDDREGTGYKYQGEDYSHVQRVGSDNVLMLQRGLMKEPVDTGTSDTSPITRNQKPTVCNETTLSVNGPAANGYVDTATMFIKPTQD
uniref:Prolactin receptor n=1 Tax=Gouania willdenowi TaxID=441366 RepID=A0A8C5EW71_GOUWI